MSDARLLVHLLILGLAGCGRCASGDPPGQTTAPANAPADAAAGGDGASPALEATPVRTAAVARASLAVTVSGPGRTDAVEKQVIRAPFAGTIVTFDAAEGDRVRDGQVIGKMVSRNSEAALEGAREMLRTARTPAERRDARRALELARKGLVTAELRAPEAGTVLSHKVDEGSQVNENDELAEIVATDSIVFVAQLSQRDLAAVHPGQPATIAMASGAPPLPGTVHALLPSGSPTDLTAPVRIDFTSAAAPRTLNLFGVATITVGHHAGATVVPAAAVLRNDITGVSTIATVTLGSTVHWVTVETGMTSGGRTEILSPALPVGERVIVSGQVGLPEGARVQPEP